MSGEQMHGKCQICGEARTLQRTYFHYAIKCECHSPNHVELIDHCEDCVPKEPAETKITFKTSELKRLVLIDSDKFEHLLNCMCNQKYIHEQSAKIRDEWQEIIDKACHEARSLPTIGGR